MWVPPPEGPGWLRSWLERHQHPLSFCLHLVGIPLTAAGVAYPLRGRWGLAAGLFAGGYALQFIGHAAEGSPPGEVLAVKRLIGSRQRRAGGPAPDTTPG